MKSRTFVSRTVKNQHIYSFLISKNMNEDDLWLINTMSFWVHEFWPIFDTINPN